MITTFIFDSSRKFAIQAVYNHNCNQLMYFAHTDEEHTSDTSTLEHLITEPSFAIPVFILIIIGIFFGLKSLGVNPMNIILIELAFMLIVGIMAYSILPIISIIALTIGIIGALFISLTLLRGA